MNLNDSSAMTECPVLTVFSALQVQITVARLFSPVMFLNFSVSDQSVRPIHPALEAQAKCLVPVEIEQVN